MLTEQEFYKELSVFDRDWEDVKPAGAWSFGTLPSGIYQAIVVDARLTDSSSGTAGLLVRFEIAEGEYDGRCLQHSFWITCRNLFYVKRDMKAMGYDIKTPPDILSAREHLLNRRVILHICREEFLGKAWNSIRKFSKVVIQ